MAFFQPLPFGSARSVLFFPWGFPFGSGRCGMPSGLVPNVTSPAGSVQTFAALGPKACALSSLTRPERFLFHDADRLVCSGGFPVACSCIHFFSFSSAFHLTRCARCGYCVPLSCFWFRCRALRPVSSLRAEPPAFCDTIQARVPCFVSVQGGRKREGRRAPPHGG